MVYILQVPILPQQIITLKIITFLEICVDPLTTTIELRQLISIILSAIYLKAAAFIFSMSGKKTSIF